MSMKVFAISIITNYGAGIKPGTLDHNNIANLDHDNIVNLAHDVGPKLMELLTQMIIKKG